MYAPSLKRERDEDLEHAESNKRIKLEENTETELEVTKKELLEYLSNWPGASKIRMRDGTARDEEESGILKWRVISNDGSRENMKLLTQLKCIITTQLPNMPPLYVSHHVFDSDHKSLIGIKNNRPICGITFRPFYKKGAPAHASTPLIEMVFCAVTNAVQRGGYGTRLMNQMKAWCQQNNLYHILTCADNTAIGYFARQGFSTDIQIKRSEYDYYLQEYNNVTFMHYVVDANIDYLNISSSLHIQRACYIKKLNEICNQHIIYPGLAMGPGQVHYDMSKVLGLTECGWDPSSYEKLVSEEVQAQIQSENRRLLEAIKTDVELSDPFHQPVVELYPNLASEYLKVVSDPIDLRTIAEKLEVGYYIKTEVLIADLHRMLDNCKQYLIYLCKGNENTAKTYDLYLTANTINDRYLANKKRELRLVLD